VERTTLASPGGNQVPANFDKVAVEKKGHFKEGDRGPSTPKLPVRGSHTMELRSSGSREKKPVLKKEGSSSKTGTGMVTGGGARTRIPSGCVLTQRNGTVDG